MKTLSFWKKSIYSALIFFGTLMVLSVGYALLSSGLTNADKVGSGSGLTATSWNNIVKAIFELDDRTTNIFSSGGNVGIGVNPSSGAKLEVDGDIFINGNNVPYKKLASCNGANYVSQTIGTGIPQICGGVTFYPTHNGGETVNGQAVAQCVCMGW